MISPLRIANGIDAYSQLTHAAVPRDATHALNSARGQHLSPNGHPRGSTRCGLGSGTTACQFLNDGTSINFFSLAPFVYCKWLTGREGTHHVLNATCRPSFIHLAALILATLFVCIASWTQPWRYVASFEKTWRCRIVHWLLQHQYCEWLSGKLDAIAT